VLKLGSVAEVKAAERDLTRIVKAWCEWRTSEAIPKALPKTKAKAKPASPARRKGR
jgi:hypothetical protein